MQHYTTGGGHATLHNWLLQYRPTHLTISHIKLLGRAQPVIPPNIFLLLIKIIAWGWNPQVNIKGQIYKIRFLNACGEIGSLGSIKSRLKHSIIMKAQY